MDRLLRVIEAARKIVIETNKSKQNSAVMGLVGDIKELVDWFDTDYNLVMDYIDNKLEDRDGETHDTPFSILAGAFEDYAYDKFLDLEEMIFEAEDLGLIELDDDF